MMFKKMSNQELLVITGGKKHHSKYYRDSYEAGKAYGAMARDLIAGMLTLGI